MDAQMKLIMTGIILELFFMLLHSYQPFVRIKTQKITVDKAMISLLSLNLEISVITLEICTVKFFFFIGYGHITTKTTQGKIATILYSAFGVPLMMLFVANIGSTMAKMFAFVFSRITRIFCCRMSNKKKRALALKNRQKL